MLLATIAFALVLFLFILFVEVDRLKGERARLTLMALEQRRLEGFIVSRLEFSSVRERELFEKALDFALAETLRKLGR